MCLPVLEKQLGLALDQYPRKIRKLTRFPYFEFSLSHAQRSLIRQNLAELDFKTARKSLLAVEIDHVIVERPGLRQQAHNLATIPGISPFTAIWILAEIGNISQFPSYRKFLAYCGCCPRVVSSAGKVYEAHISRHSNSYLRTIFYNAAVVVCNLVKKESVLKDYAKRIISRKSSRAMKLAYCIVGAKIARIVYSILRTGIEFDPEHGRTLINQTKRAEHCNFSVSDKKLIRRARNCLKRVKEIDNLGIIGDHAKILAEELDIVL